MKRNFDLLRELLFLLEEKPDMSPWLWKDPPSIEGHDDKEVKYHLILLYQGGLVDGEPMRSTTSDRIIDMGAVFALTWEGHEFLEKIRSDDVWEGVKQKARSIGGNLTFQALSRVATWFVEQALHGELGGGACWALRG